MNYDDCMKKTAVLLGFALLAAAGAGVLGAARDQQDLEWLRGQDAPPPESEAQHENQHAQRDELDAGRELNHPVSSPDREP